MQCKDLLGIDESTYAKILAALRVQAGPSSQAGGLCFNLKTPMVAMFNHNNAAIKAAYQVRTIDIAPRVIRFLHGRSEPAGTPMVALLHDIDGKLRMISGTVERSRLVSSTIHALRLHTQEELDPSEFVRLDGMSEEQREQVSTWHQNWKSLVKMDDAALFTLMEKIKRREDSTELRAKRRSKRLRYQQGAILVVLNPDDAKNWGAFRVPTMDLSEGGLGFLHGMYVYPGTRCDILLTTLDGRTEITPGKVARCEVAQGTTHQIGVQFDEPIDVGRFLSADETKERLAS